MQIRCNFPDISYLSETQKNNFQFLNNFQQNTLCDFIMVSLLIYLNGSNKTSNNIIYVW